MTVSVASDYGIECIWIGEEGELFRETLQSAVLKAAEDEGDSEPEEADEADAEEERKIA